MIAIHRARFLSGRIAVGNLIFALQTEITRFGSIANVGSVSVPNASCTRNPGIAGARESLQTEAAIISEMWRRAFRSARVLTVYYRLPTGISLHGDEGFRRFETSMKL